MLRDLTNDQRAAVIVYIRARAGLSDAQPDLKVVCSQGLSEPAGISLPSSGLALGHSEGPHDMDMTHAFTATAPVYFPAVPVAADGSVFQNAAKAWIDAVSAIESHTRDEDIPRDLCDAQSATWRGMLDTPAPDLASLRFKLERLLQIEPAVDATNTWDGAEVHQTLADIARLMAGPAIPVVPATTQVACLDVDQEISAEWQRWHATFARYNALPHDDPAEKGCWEIIDAAEAAIRAAVARTPAGAAIQVKVAFHHMLTRRDDAAALMAGDLDHLENARLDWPERLVLSALRSLETQALASEQVRRFSSESEWKAAMLAYHEARENEARYRRDVYTPADEADDPVPAQIDEEMGRLDRMTDDEIYRIIDTPAPDVDALRWKLKTLLCGDADGINRVRGDGDWDSLSADLDRLLRSAAAMAATATSQTPSFDMMRLEIVTGYLQRLIGSMGDSLQSIADAPERDLGHAADHGLTFHHMAGEYLDEMHRLITDYYADRQAEQMPLAA